MTFSGWCRGAEALVMVACRAVRHRVEGLAMSPRWTEIVRQKIDAGLLPLDRPSKVWTAFGRGGPCSGCGATITAAQTAYEFEDAGKSYRLHLGCFGVWEVERRQRLSSTLRAEAYPVTTAMTRRAG